MTFNDIRDGVYQALRQVFPNTAILDLGSIPRTRPRTFLEIELPVVAYSLAFRPHYERVVDEETVVDLEVKKATVTQKVPYAVRLIVSTHSDIQAEAEELFHQLHRAWGFAPCFGGVGWHLLAVEYSGIPDLTGVYSFYLTYEGWVRIEGPAVELPLVEMVQWQYWLEESPPLEEHTSPEPDEVETSS